MKILRSEIEKRLAEAYKSEPYFKTHEVVEKRIKGKLVRVEKYIGCNTCLLYTSDAADDLLCVDLGCRRTIKKKNKNHTMTWKI